ncbi:MAG: hypothetical protein IJ734_08055 [Fibrobacter sp.]|nr:hypothetical protein [Fibrobacter sp.]
MNNCASGSEWVLNVQASSTGNGAAWTVGSLDTECEVLTPRFGDLARGTAKTTTP